MALKCCNLVADFDINDRCIISISVNSSTETQNICEDEILVGPTICTVSVTGYASNSIHVGCPARANVSVPWMRRQDCEGKVYFIFSGEGNSSIVGDVKGMASIHRKSGREYTVVSASSSSGPATIYTKDTQVDGFGLTYSGDPYSFSTTEEGVKFNRIIDIGPATWSLQSFNLNMQPGQLPTASYSFVFQIEE